MKSDNGPPFNGHEFEDFANYVGFKHKNIKPYWPRANGEAKRLVRTPEKNIRIAHIERKNWKQESYRFLRQYRATSHSTTNVSPCEALNKENSRLCYLNHQPLDASNKSLCFTMRQLA